MKLHIIPTGGTFDKVYNELTGELLIDRYATSISEIIALSRGNIDAVVEPIIHKDSNDFIDEDRGLLLRTVIESEREKIIIIHGTDTMDKSAKFLAESLRTSKKRVIFVGAMTPYSISRDEAIFNFATALGFLNTDTPTGVYICMHGLVLPHNKIKKNKELGVFDRVG